MAEDRVLEIATDVALAIAYLALLAGAVWVPVRADLRRRARVTLESRGSKDDV